MPRVEAEFRTLRQDTLITSKDPNCSQIDFQKHLAGYVQTTAGLESTSPRGQCEALPRQEGGCRGGRRGGRGVSEGPAGLPKSEDRPRTEAAGAPSSAFSTARSEFTDLLLSEFSLIGHRRPVVEPKTWR